MGKTLKEAGWSSLADLVYEELLTAIVEHRLPAGSRLVPETLAKELGVSPTPVKLALARLTSERLVTSQPRRGALVTPMDHEELVALFEARLLVERAVARDYLQALTPNMLLTLEALAAEYRLQVDETGNLDQRRHLGELDHRFHGTIVSLAGNAHITRWFEQTNVHLQAYRASDENGRYAETIAEHEQILSALRSGSPETASEAIATHIRNAIAYYSALYRMSNRSRLRPVGS